MWLFLFYLADNGLLFCIFFFSCSLLRLSTSLIYFCSLPFYGVLTYLGLTDLPSLEKGDRLFSYILSKQLFLLLFVRLFRLREILLSFISSFLSSYFCNFLSWLSLKWSKVCRFSSMVTKVFYFVDLSILSGSSVVLILSNLMTLVLFCGLDFFFGFIWTDLQGDISGGK